LQKIAKKNFAAINCDKFKERFALATTKLLQVCLSPKCKSLEKSNVLEQFTENPKTLLETPKILFVLYSNRQQTMVRDDTKPTNSKVIFLYC